MFWQPVCESPIKVKPCRVFFSFKPFTPSPRRKPHFQQYQYFKPVLATEGALHHGPGYPSKEQILSYRCPIKSSSPNPNFYNSRHNFGLIRCGSNASSRRQDLCLPFLHLRHLSVPTPSEAHKGHQTEPALPLDRVESRGARNTAPFPLSPVQMAATWLSASAAPHRGIRPLASLFSSPHPALET